MGGRADQDAIREFIGTVHGPAMAEGMHCLVWESLKKSTRFFRDIGEAAACAAELARAGRDVYTGVGGVHAPPAKGRGKKGDIGYIVGMWADIDIAGPTHKSGKALPPDVFEARRIVEAVGPVPTYLVESGGGLHVWWLFDEPWLFESDAERAEAAALAAAWNATVRAVAQGMGFDADPVHDITRVLRIPGTWNTAADRPVAVAAYGGATYSPDDLREFCIDEEFAPLSATDGARPRRAEVAAVAVGPDRGLPPCAMELITGDAKFRRTWERRRKDLADQSASSYDMAVANEGVYREWSDQEIADTIFCWRTKHEDRPEKGRRRDYLSNTIGRAKADLRRREEERQEREEKKREREENKREREEKKREREEERAGPVPLRKLAEMDAMGDEPEAETIRALLSEAFQKEFSCVHRVMCSPPQFTITFLDPEVTINLGSGDGMGFTKFKHSCNNEKIVIPTPLRKRWDEVQTWLFRLAVDIEDPEAKAQERVGVWIEEYLADEVLHSGDSWHDGIKECQPLLYGGYLWINSMSLHRFVQTIMRERDLTAAEMRQMLRECGWTTALAQRPGRAPKPKRYWRLPVKDAQHWLEGLET